MSAGMDAQNWHGSFSWKTCGAQFCNFNIGVDLQLLDIEDVFPEKK